jgi:FKBP-type peptidyl-prolyl cis-trans isomerase FklB
MQYGDTPVTLRPFIFLVRAFSIIHLQSTMLLIALIISSLLVVARASNAEGLAYLEENGKKPGVVTLPSGMQYKVLEKGEGNYHPGPNTRCSCHYHGTLIDGTVFDSSYDRGQPTSFAPNQVIKGS